MNIKVYVKDGVGVDTEKVSDGIWVSVNVDVDKILNEVEVHSDGRKHGTLYINRNNNSQWKEA